MKRHFTFAIAVSFFPVVIAIDAWFFQTFFNHSYVDWYIANGTFISIVASLFSVIVKNLNDNRDLISPNPRLFLSANLLLAGPLLEIIGKHSKEAGNRIRTHRPIEPGMQGSSPLSDILDGLGSIITNILMVCALAVWLLAVVPMQYFIVLLAGAPARIASKLHGQRRNPAVMPENAPSSSNKMNYLEENLLTSPVSLTNSLAALLIFAVKLICGDAAQ